MIVGITGPICAGKGRTAEIFRKKGFAHHSFSAEIRQVAKERGIEVNRRSLGKLGADLRKESPDFSILGAKVLNHIRKDILKGAHIFVVEGLREFDELYLFREHEMENPDFRFVLIGVDSPQELRYRRLRLRKRHGDPETFEEFAEIDNKEIKGGGGQEVGKCMKLADYIIDNSGTIAELENKVNEIINEIR
ncbi:AAA family ATPase [Nanoarchaeota archaeon]